jgi:hypothetical protein
MKLHMVLCQLREKQLSILSEHSFLHNDSTQVAQYFATLMHSSQADGAAASGRPICRLHTPTALIARQAMFTIAKRLLLSLLA